MLKREFIFLFQIGMSQDPTKDVTYLWLSIKQQLYSSIMQCKLILLFLVICCNLYPADFVGGRQSQFSICCLVYEHNFTKYHSLTVNRYTSTIKQLVALFQLLLSFKGNNCLSYEVDICSFSILNENSSSASSSSFQNHVSSSFVKPNFVNHDKDAVTDTLIKYRINDQSYHFLCECLKMSDTHFMFYHISCCLHSSWELGEP